MTIRSERPHNIRIGAAALALTLAILVVDCGGKKPPPPPPPPPVTTATPTTTPTGRPVINSFTAEPSAINRGQSSTLRWSTTGATDMNIDQGIGAVQGQGTRQVYPNDSTTYTLTVRGPGGTDSRSATVTVTTPEPPPPPTRTGGPIDGPGILAAQSKDAYFDYDKSDIRPDARDALTQDAALLKQIFSSDPQFTVVIEGHCDERGSAEYNLALGDRRASSARDFLVQLGVPADRLKTISYGKERPQCTEENEACWQRNRRAHLSPGQ